MWKKQLLNHCSEANLILCLKLDLPCVSMMRSYKQNSLLGRYKYEAIYLVILSVNCYRLQNVTINMSKNIWGRGWTCLFLKCTNWDSNQLFFMKKSTLPQTAFLNSPEFRLVVERINYSLFTEWTGNYFSDNVTKAAAKLGLGKHHQIIFLRTKCCVNFMGSEGKKKSG